MSFDELSAVAVDGYVDFARIGTGGFSSVYRAKQESLGRDVAIKVLHGDLGSPEALQTFERECRALGVLSRHPNIVTVYHDAATVDGRRCIVMELCHGTVRESLERNGPLPLDEVLRIGLKVGSALQHAHDEGILHRDVKPHNIFISDYGEPALGDFGISTIDLERSAEVAAGLSLAYASPEALDGKRPTRASDIYGLGATLFHLIEGVTPFAAPQMEATMTRIMTKPPPDLRREGAPPALQSVIHQCLAKQPVDRPASAWDVVMALREIEETLGFDRTPLPVQRPVEPEIEREQSSGVPPAADDPTIGRPGQAMESAMSASNSGAPDRVDDIEATPSLWPPGWSPWHPPDDDDTITRAPRRDASAASTAVADVLDERSDSRRDGRRDGRTDGGTDGGSGSPVTGAAAAGRESPVARRRSTAVAFAVGAAVIVGVVLAALLLG